MGTGSKDKYGQIAYVTTTTSAADTLTFTLLNMGVSIFDKMAMLISRLEYTMNVNDLNLLVDNADVIQIGLTTNNTMAALGLDDPNVADLLNLQVADFGTPASAHIQQFPLVKDLSQRSGGGLLVPPRPIYLGVDSASLGSVITVYCRIHFTFVKLSPQDYIELVESSRIIQ